MIHDGFLLKNFKKLFSPTFLILPLVFLFGFLSSENVFSQTAIITPTTPFEIGTPNCPQNNLRITSVDFRDPNTGESFKPEDLYGTPIGTPINGDIYVTFAVSGNGYNFHVQYDFLINGVVQGSRRALCIVVEDGNGNTINITNGLEIKVTNFTWNYGDKLEIKNVYQTWVTGNAKPNDKSCPSTAGNSQCDYRPQGFVIETPVVANFSYQTFCDNRNVSFTNLSTGGADNIAFSYVWDFGDGSTSTAINPTHTYTSAGTYTVKLISTKGLESDDETKNITVYDPTSLTINAPPSACAPGTVDLTAGSITSGSSPGLTFTYWLDANATQTLANPSAVANSGTYYIKGSNGTNGCFLIKPVIVTINQAPVAPLTGGDQVVCEASPIQTLTATATVPAGFSVVWYDAAVGGNLVANPTKNTTGTVTYYAEAKNNTTNCVSLTRTAVSLTINPAPTAPVSGGDQVVCQANPIQTLTATATAPAGSSVVWYDAAVGGNVVANPTKNTTGTVTYYAASKNNTTNCESLTRTAVSLTINAAPTAPVSGGDQVVCEVNPIQTLTATASAPAGSSVVWYDAAVGGNVVANPTKNTTGTVTYYAASKNNTTNCESLTRTAVSLTIDAAPTAPVSGGDQVQCEASPIQTLTATATAPAGSSVVWYDAAVGGNVVANPVKNSVGAVTYYAESVNTTTNCKSLTRTAVSLTIQAAPAAPVSGGNQIECLKDPIQTLTATATVPQGFTLVWYDAAVGGNVVANPTRNTVGSVTYYAEAINNATNCKSLTRTAVVLSILDAPQPPVSDGDITICEGDAEKITASASGPGTIVWYDAATGGNIVPDPSLSTVGTVTYYAQSEGGSCSSLIRTPVKLTINAAPVAPVSGGDQVECEEGPIQTLTATATVPQGFSVVWYDAAVGGNVVASPTKNTTGTVTYYAASKNNTTNCESLTRTAVSLTINAAPVAPVSGGDQVECEEGPIQTLTATATVPQGFSVVWYDASVGGNVVASPTKNTTGTVTYYAASKNNTTNCESLTRTAVSLTINTAPVAPVSGGDQVECEGSPIQTLTATATVPQGFSVVWYDAAVGGNVVTNPVKNSVGTVIYYAEAVNSATNCVSLTRTAVSLTINPAPVAPVSGGDQVECEEGPIQTLTATATVPQGFSVVWYDAAVGGNVVASPTLNTVGTITYYAEAVNNETDCISLSRTAVSLTIQAAPVAPVSGGDQVECEEGPIQTLTATATVPQGFNVVWYDAAVGGNVVNNPTLNSVGSITYYAQSVNSSTNCVSLSRTAVSLTILAAPVAPISGGDQVECEEGPIQTLTATATVPQGFGVVWYDAAVGGNVVANPTLNSVGTITYYAEAVNNETNCISLTRTAVSLTIQAAPVAPVSGGNQVVCLENPIQTLTATATVLQGFSVVWYDQSIGGNVVANPILNTVGSVTYYAEAVNNTTNCVSLTRTAVLLTILDAPAPPVSDGDITICEGDQEKITASASGPGTIVWYDAAEGGNVVADPSLSSVGSVTYYAQSIGTSCSSLTRTAVTLTINPAPVSPVSGGNQTICEGDASSITATASVPQGFSVVWYSAAIGGNVVANPTLSSVGTVTFYAEAVNNETNCTSLSRTGVTLTINPAPVAPVSGGNQTICEGDASSITATASVPQGFSVVWYSAAIGGNVVANPTLSTVGTVTYYAQSVNNTTNCASLTRTAVSLTINPAPVAPVSGGNKVSCFNGENQLLTATATVPQGFSVVWYTAPTGGSVVANPSLSAVGSVTYYAEAVNAGTGCSSLTRTPVTLTFNSCAITLTKTADVESVDNAGDVITYTLTVTNTGNSALSNVTITDPLTGLNQNVGSLAGGESTNVQTSYTVTQADVDKGEILNIASVKGTAINAEVSAQDDAVVTAVQNPDIDIEITDNDPVLDEPGDEIPYTIVVTNTGNVTLDNVTVVDTKTGTVVNVGTLAPGESKTIEATYPITQEDVDTGSVKNEATATGESPNEGDDNPTATDEVTTPILQLPGILVEKSADKDVIREAGEVVVYTITVTNTGNVVLNNVVVKDPLTGLEQSIGTLSAGQSVSVETSYTVTVDDLVKETLVNVATVTAEAPDGEDISDEAEEVVGVGANEIIANDDDFGTYF
ncbi:putative repeat protein (TIGR01451 family), partial [Algoriphagus boseongensis]